MNTKIQRTFSITITKDYKLICTIINIENQESSVYLDENNQTEEYIPCISFHNDRIMICQENEQNSINFIKEFIENPEQFKLYSFEFQGKEYKIIAEVLFALIINEFKQKIEREYIIDQTIVQFPSQHCQISERIRNSLESIGLKNIFVDSLSFDYSEQSEVLQELLEKKDQIDTYQRMLKRARNYCETNKQIQQINYCQQSVVSEETFVNTIQSFTTKEREQLKLCTLDNYCLFIASRYFETIADHQNFSMVSRRLKKNMEKFHYNPISVNEQTFHLFPNIETFHCYHKNGYYLKGGRINKYVDWRKLRKCQIKEKQRENRDKSIEFKKYIFNADDVSKQIYKQNYDIYDYNEKQAYFIQIPEGVDEISSKTFSNEFVYGFIGEITMSSTVKIIPKNCFEDCHKLKNLTIPLNQTRVLYENKIFNNHKHFNQSFYLSNTLEMINNTNVSILTSITIPSFVTSIDNNCFYGCYHLKEIIGLKNVINQGNLSLDLFNEKYFDLTTDKFYITNENKWNILYGISNSEIKQLEDWTQLKCGEILFNSDVDDWSKDTSTFNDKIIGKSRVRDFPARI